MYLSRHDFIDFTVWYCDTKLLSTKLSKWKITNFSMELTIWYGAYNILHPLDSLIINYNWTDNLLRAHKYTLHYVNKCIYIYIKFYICIYIKFGMQTFGSGKIRILCTLCVYICIQQLIVHIHIRSIGFAQHRFIVSLVPLCSLWLSRC